MMNNSITRAGALAALFLLTISIAASCARTPQQPSAGSGPAFVINSPPAGSLIAGTFVFSVQPLDPGSVASVAFRHGEASLGTVSDGSAGWRVYVRSSDLPDGNVNLTASVTGTDGRTSTRSVSINNSPAPGSTANVGTQGAVLGTTEADGSLSTMVIPAGGALGANVSFDARTQEQVLAETGVDYDALGLTFLGAQEITTDREFDRTPLVTSGGFGPAVQPGQIVVNYVIRADGDGDGIGDIVVANTASVTPDGDVISDPTPVVQVGATGSTANVLGTSNLQPLDSLSGPPGTLIRIPVGGFNSASPWNNIAVFEAGESTVEQTGLIQLSASGAQTFVTAIPLLPAGSATVTLHNVGSGLSSESFRVNVQNLPAAAGDPLDVINDARDAVLGMLQEFDSRVPGTDSSELRAAITASLDFWVAELTGLGTPEADQALADMAGMIRVSDLTGLVADVRSGLLGSLRVSQAGCNDILDKADSAINVVNWVARIPYTTISPTNAVDIIGPELQGGMTGQGWKWMKNTALEIDSALGGNACREDEPPMPGPTGPSEDGTSSLNITSGMGAAFPAGGGLVGTVNGPGLNPFSPLSSAQSRGRYVAKVSSTVPVPFSGSTDASGYFVIPATPAGEPITVTVIDTKTGDVDVITIDGPEAGQSEFLNFSFLNPVETESVSWTGAAGDGRWATAANWSTGVVPQPFNEVTIASPSALITLDSAFDTSIIRRLNLSAGTLILEGSGVLHILTDSTVGASGNVQLDGFDAILGVDGELVLNGDLLWSRGELKGKGQLINQGHIEVNQSTGVRQLSGDVLNSGTMVLLGTGSEGLRIGQGGTIRNAAAGVIDFQSDFGIFHGGDPRGEIHNTGTVRKSGGNGASNIDADFFAEGGTLEVSVGTLHLRSGGGLSLEPDIQVAAGARLNIGFGTSNFTLSGELAGSGSGALRLTGGTLHIDTAGASFAFPNGTVEWAGTDITGLGDLTNTGLLLVSGTDGLRSDLHDITLYNQDVIRIASGDRHLGLGRGATIINQPGALIEISGDTSIRSSGDPYATIVNQGTVLRSSGSEPSLLNAFFDNQGGTVQVDSGNLTLAFGATDSGEFTVASGAELQLGRFTSSEFQLAGDLSGTGAGAVIATGNIDVAGSAVTLDFPTGGFQLEATISGVGGTVTNSGLMEVDRESGITVRINQITLNNNGTFNLRGSGTGSLLVGDGMILNNVGLFDIQGDFSIGYTILPYSPFNNSGVLLKSAGDGEASLALCYVSDGGTLTEAAGTLIFTGGASCP